MEAAIDKGWLWYDTVLQIPPVVSLLIRQSPLRVLSVMM